MTTIWASATFHNGACIWAAGLRWTYAPRSNMNDSHEPSFGELTAAGEASADTLPQQGDVPLNINPPTVMAEGALFNETSQMSQPNPASPNAAAAGTFLLGGELPVARLGFGTLHTVGRGGWGDPADPVLTRELLRLVPKLGINLIDTADAYGPHTGEHLLREVLHPYDTVVIATKGGQVRPSAGEWRALGRPEYLKQAAQLSRRRLGVESIDLWQLHRIDRRVPRDEQFGAIRELREEGVIRHVGLSECQIEDIELAQRFFPVATVQNQYSLSNRRSENVLDYCTEQGIGFMPWGPLGSGRLAAGHVLSEVAAELGATPMQVALAWLLRRSPVMLPIPGTSRPAHLRENVAAAALTLNDDQFERLDQAGRSEWLQELSEEEDELL